MIIVIIFVLFFVVLVWVGEGRFTEFVVMAMFLGTFFGIMVAFILPEITEVKVETKELFCFDDESEDKVYGWIQHDGTQSTLIFYTKENGVLKSNEVAFINVSVEYIKQGEDAVVEEYRKESKDCIWNHFSLYAEGNGVYAYQIKVPENSIKLSK